jgi:hypothetical protein
MRTGRDVSTRAGATLHAEPSAPPHGPRPSPLGALFGGTCSCMATTATRVTEVAADGSVLVDAPSFGRVAARNAVLAYCPRPGDRVLTVLDADGTRYVVGVVSRPGLATPIAAPPVADGHSRRAADGEAATLRAADGTRASIERDQLGHEVLRVVDAQGALLLEHRPGEGTRIVARAHGDLELATAGKLTLHGDAGVEIHSARALRVDVAELEARTRRAEIEAGDVELRAATSSVTLERLRTTVGVLEVRAQRIVERAGEVFREVKGLAQTRAGRIKLLAEHALDLVGRHAELRASEDVKVKGERIYLG